MDVYKFKNTSQNVGCLYDTPVTGVLVDAKMENDSHSLCYSSNNVEVTFSEKAIPAPHSKLT